MSDSDTSHTNRLAGETSPYLLQHAHNPVDWYPWGPEALARAKAEDRPIFLSIGYAACHWCHVMEHESFEDDETAALMNEHFVSIKVDREERPDLDSIYMDAVQAMTGHGGWPMSVFLTPEGRPFYGGTYFPNQRRYGMPSFRDVLGGLAHAWQEQRDQVETAGRQLTEAIAGEGRRATGASGAVVPVASWSNVLEAALGALEEGFDARNGGWGGAPKFPQPMTVEFLLRRFLRGGDQRAIAMARHTLDRMAAGGIYDHLGGGFARYATDEAWLVPHFEKMLYDNAQLARVYVHAWQVTGDGRYREVVEETLDYLLREMTVRGDSFAASQDADTEGEEGATYVWRQPEIQEVLGDDAPLFEGAYGVTSAGNWEGVTILSRVRDDAALATDFELEVAEVATRLGESRRRLLERRRMRPQPARDDKALSAWNGLAIGALADAGGALDRPDYVAAATRAADFLLRVLGKEGRLRRSWKDGRASHNGVLEDYTHVADGLLALYEQTFDERFFVAARELADRALDHFSDPQGGFFDTSDDHEALVTRPKGLQDNALPSGNAMAALVLLRLAALTGEDRYRDAAERSLALVAPVAGRYPTAFGQWLVAADLAASPIDEIALIGDSASPEMRALLAVVHVGYRPNRVVALAGNTEGTQVPLLRDRALVGGKPSAYVCQGFACRQPVTEPAELKAQLGERPS
ncbi:MAG TPA: thioredoxin domain-containing protein [Candidatus Limnocylindrales bacterium]|nr:thioredoxin domain-containing protein [Candidatus Limnocylindrales bacterium]